jgi:hypothetical protein
VRLPDRGSRWQSFERGRFDGEISKVAGVEPGSRIAFAYSLCRVETGVGVTVREGEAHGVVPSSHEDSVNLDAEHVNGRNARNKSRHPDRFALSDSPCHGHVTARKDTTKRDGISKTRLTQNQSFSISRYPLNRYPTGSTPVSATN